MPTGVCYSSAGIQSLPPPRATPAAERFTGDVVLSALPNNIRSTTPGAFVPAVGAEPSPGYRLRCVRGRGGFAEVWEAEAPTGPPVALKFMPTSNTATTARELRSVKSFQGMEHPYIVKTYDVWSIPGYLVINMELAEATLLDLMQVYRDELGQDIEPATLCLYLWQVAEALDFLNARQHVRDGRRVGFQHGDVKPNNILLFGDVAKLTDHGLATPTHAPSTPCARQGTREYAAPEVFLGSISDWSDQFSLAVTYYALRTGTFPFAPPVKAASRSSLRPLANLSGVTDAEQPALRRALAPVPQERFPNCLEFMAALLKALKLRVELPDGEGGRMKVTREAAISAGSGVRKLATPALSVSSAARKTPFGSGNV
ncbi:serine/threonine protein kinase [Gemmata obscuriglobus]|uniref:Serine/threonine protein kinase n=1 Tax=Gemmata obscuriglobus TaxID=114 RepID=A0A2Z3GXR9_9BACT|nr:serine/threonine protein kinase [Gemmata obscuriglobus]VTS09113.1 serine threonine protein kinase : Serine/threonine protein kinase OS=Singulisphaera acidiphila (strain ATCC BAA-1392 / DSM 18658 / VKM B-2454 / MOB10) GN=Sinac_0241 PE=4 SV=1: Pkinase [Gemmata obscuriglobus UQM 2246]